VSMSALPQSIHLCSSSPQKTAKKKVFENTVESVLTALTEGRYTFINGTSLLASFVQIGN